MEIVHQWSEQLASLGKLSIVNALFDGHQLSAIISGYHDLGIVGDSHE